MYYSNNRINLNCIFVWEKSAEGPFFMFLFPVLDLVGGEKNT